MFQLELKTIEENPKFDSEPFAHTHTHTKPKLDGNEDDGKEHGKKKKNRKGKTFKYISLLEFHVKLCFFCFVFIYFQFEIFYFYHFAHIKCEKKQGDPCIQSTTYIFYTYESYECTTAFIFFLLILQCFSKYWSTQQFSLDFVITYLGYV